MNSAQNVSVCVWQVASARLSLTKKCIIIIIIVVVVVVIIISYENTSSTSSEVTS